MSLSEENGYVPAEDAIKYNLSAVESHKKELNNQYKVDASAVALPDLMKRYDKIVGVWKLLTFYCQKNNKFLLIFEEFRDIIRADPMESSFKK